MKEIRLHIIGLFIYSVSLVFIDWIFLKDGFSLILELIVLAEEIWIFYTGYFFLYFLFTSTKEKKLYSIPIIILNIGGVFMIMFFYDYVSDTLYKKIDHPLIETIYNVSQFFIHYFIFSIGFFFFTRFKFKNEEAQLLLEKNLTLQKNLLQSENDFLRAQINPHFLYNSLNYFYSETFEVLPKVSDSIMMLSDIMRYSLTDFSANNGLANLEEEIENIQNIININKCRFDNNLHIQLTVNGEPEGKKIVPMMFITLVENLFKHGDLQDAAHPAYIECNIDEHTKNVTFITSNKKSMVKNVIPGGLGTSNIKKRLELLYGNGFELDFEEEVAIYKATLVIPYFENKTNNT
jgi:two-component system, LytTR family, sensor kinase